MPFKDEEQRRGASIMFFASIPLAIYLLISNNVIQKDGLFFERFINNLVYTLGMYVACAIGVGILVYISWMIMDGLRKFESSKNLHTILFIGFVVISAILFSI